MRPRRAGPGGDKPGQQGVGVEEARRRLEVYRKSNFLDIIVTRTLSF